MLLRSGCKILQFPLFTIDLVFGAGRSYEIIFFFQSLAWAWYHSFDISSQSFLSSRASFRVLFGHCRMSNKHFLLLLFFWLWFLLGQVFQLGLAFILVQVFLAKIVIFLLFILVVCCFHRKGLSRCHLQIWVFECFSRFTWRNSPLYVIMMV